MQIRLANGGCICQEYFRDEFRSAAERFMTIKTYDSLLILLMFFGSVACGGTDDGQSQQSACAVETRADTYVQGLEKAGETLSLRLLDAQPAPPEVGNNEWVFEVSDRSGLVTSATVSVKPWMPDHGHGTTPLYLDATPPDTGSSYRLGPMDLFMPGYWTLTFEIEHQSVREEIVFGFCLEG